MPRRPHNPLTPYKLRTCLMDGCRYQWFSQANPRQCPKCQSRAWRTGERGRPGRPRKNPIEQLAATAA
jgi:hypothetical protein